MSTHHFPTLYKLASDGVTVQQWTISVNSNVITTTYGQYQGKLQQAVNTITKGKNIGRSNETTPTEQAYKEAKAEWTKKQGTGYVQDLTSAKAGAVDKTIITGGLAPMLAHKFRDHADKISYPACVQPKLDGIRCVAIMKNNVCTLWTRLRKPITSVPHIVQTIETLYAGQDIILDGELYNHDYRDNFQYIVSLVKSKSPKPDHTKVQFHIFDVVCNKRKFLERAADLKNDKSKHLHLVDTEVVETEADATIKFNEYLSAGFEGCMIRNIDSVYEHSRSYNLQKIKSFDDTEFPIVDVIPGRKGKFVNLGLLICRTTNDKEFEVVLNGPLSNLKDVLLNKQNYIGKLLTVKHQGYTNDGIPRFVKGVAVRDYE